MQMMPAIERTDARHGRPTYYETLLALAFAYFAAERVDVAVIEVGLGGRFDGTNVLAAARRRDYVGRFRSHRRLWARRSRRSRAKRPVSRSPA